MRLLKNELAHANASREMRDQGISNVLEKNKAMQSRISSLEAGGATFSQGPSAAFIYNYLLNITTAGKDLKADIIQLQDRVACLESRSSKHIDKGSCLHPFPSFFY